MLKYYQVFRKQIKILPPEHQLSDIYHPSSGPKNGEMLFFTVGAGLETDTLCKYHK